VLKSVTLLCVKTNRHTEATPVMLMAGMMVKCEVRGARGACEDSCEERGNLRGGVRGHLHCVELRRTMAASDSVL